ncbi:MAG: cytochrome c [bacterium]
MIINGFVFKKPLKVRGYLTFLLFLLFTIPSLNGFSQTAEAEKNFQVCKACHNIEGPKLIGPSLKGITERREEEWLIKFIQNSQAMIQAGDPIAVQVWEENNKIPMPPNPLTDDQVRDLLLYIENGGKVAEGEAAAETAAESEYAPGYVEPTAEEEFLLDLHRMSPSTSRPHSSP